MLQGQQRIDRKKAAVAIAWILLPERPNSKSAGAVPATQTSCTPPFEKPPQRSKALAFSAYTIGARPW
jgi:hypothetical protein